MRLAVEYGNNSFKIGERGGEGEGGKMRGGGKNTYSNMSVNI